MRVTITKSRVRSILTRTSGYLKTVTSHSVQPYRGCTFGNSLRGVGCYVQHNHWLTRGAEWGSFLEVRTNAPEAYRSQYQTERRWARRARGGFSIFLSSSTDPFLPQEKTFGITGSLLEAMNGQKVAYILRDGEETVPAGLRAALANANVVHEAFASEPRPAMTGREATLAIAKKLEGVDFLPSLYSHPIGYHGHALGPSINARNMDLSTPPDRDSVLRLGAYRSVEFSATTAVPEYGGGTVTIPMEDDAYLTTDGYIYFRPYQTEWYVIR